MAFIGFQLLACCLSWIVDTVWVCISGVLVSRGEMVEDQIVVGTPGTLLDWCIKFKAIDLKKINVFVLDEADVMIDQQGHQDQSVRLQRQAIVSPCLGGRSSKLYYTRLFPDAGA